MKKVLSNMGVSVFMTNVPCIFLICIYIKLYFFGLSFFRICLIS